MATDTNSRRAFLQAAIEDPASSTSERLKAAGLLAELEEREGTRLPTSDELGDARAEELADNPENRPRSRRADRPGRMPTRPRSSPDSGRQAVRRADSGTCPRASATARSINLDRSLPCNQAGESV